MKTKSIWWQTPSRLYRLIKLVDEKLLIPFLSIRNKESKRFCLQIVI